LNSLTDLLTSVVSTLQTSTLCRSVQPIETFRFSETQFGLKVRSHLISGDMLQVRLYCKGDHTDYSYQVFQDNSLIDS
jgi:hypothetical protein